MTVMAHALKRCFPQGTVTTPVEVIEYGTSYTIRKEWRLNDPHDTGHWIPPFPQGFHVRRGHLLYFPTLWEHLGVE